MYIEYLLPIVRMLFKSPLSCIHRSVRELCTTAEKRITPQFVLTSTLSMTNRHAVATLRPHAMYQTDLTSYAALWLLYQTNLPSCVARRPLCQTNLPSCVARLLLSQTNLPRCVARRTLSQTNLPSCVRPLSQAISKLLPSGEEQMTPALPREISELTSHGRINAMGSVYTSVHALMNDTWRCNGFEKCNLSNVSANVLVSKRIENRGCPFVNSERSHSRRTRTFKKKRDREPSRIPVRKVLKLLNKRKYKKRVEYLLIKSVPKSSFVRELCRNYKNWYLWHNSDNFYSKFVFFMRKEKCKSSFKYCSKIYCEQFSVRQGEFETKSNHIQDSLHTSSCYFSFLKGGMAPGSVSDNSPWVCLTERLAHISLKPYDVGGSGDCFFKSVSHQLYGTPELHFQIRIAGIRHLNDHPQLYIESISNNCWENYLQQMSTPGTWCDNIIIQAVANAHNCVIHITESDLNKPDGTVITPVVHENQRKTIFIGYINELHYVSTVPDKNNQNIQPKYFYTFSLSLFEM